MEDIGQQAKSTHFPIQFHQYFEMRFLIGVLREERLLRVAFVQKLVTYCRLVQHLQHHLVVRILRFLLRYMTSHRSDFMCIDSQRIT